MTTFFNTTENSLIETFHANQQEGNIAVYLKPDKTITHTARYVKNIDWYEYNKESHGEWYGKSIDEVLFIDSGNNCTIESYTSKLGLGYLVAHKLEDITPLYGEQGGFFDLIVPS